MIKFILKILAQTTLWFGLTTSLLSFGQCGSCDTYLNGIYNTTHTIPAGEVWCTNSVRYWNSGSLVINGTYRICGDGIDIQISANVNIGASGYIDIQDCPLRWDAVGFTTTSNTDYSVLYDCGESPTCTALPPNVANWLGSGDQSTECNTVLPIELEYFRGSYKSGAVMLNWQSLTELNNDYYIIERSTDGFYFQEMVRVDGAGTSVEPRPYSTLDFQPHHPLTYYRLTQVDYDARSASFDIIAVETGVIPVGLYPNPTESSFVIESSEDTDMLKSSAIASGHYELRIFSSTGELVLEDSYEGSQHEVSMESFPSGAYIVELTGDNGVFRDKLVKF